MVRPSRILRGSRRDCQSADVDDEGRHSVSFGTRVDRTVVSVVAGRSHFDVTLSNVGNLPAAAVFLADNYAGLYFIRWNDVEHVEQ